MKTPTLTQVLDIIRNELLRLEVMEFVMFANEDTNGVKMAVVSPSGPAVIYIEGSEPGQVTTASRFAHGPEAWDGTIQDLERLDDLSEVFDIGFIEEYDYSDFLRAVLLASAGEDVAHLYIGE